MTYDLNYLQIPIVAKYVIDIDGDFSVQPFFGGYLACGVGGKIRTMATAFPARSHTSISSASTVVCASVAVPHTTCSTWISATTSDSPTSLMTSSTHHTTDAGHSA